MLSKIVGKPLLESALGSKIVTRGKRTVRQAPGASRIITMLSVISARKKQPRRLKLCKEDLVRHNTVKAAWQIHQRDENTARAAKLEAQYNKIKEACDELQRLDPALFAAANKKQASKRFPIELRVPTATPPRVAWDSDWTPLETKK